MKATILTAALALSSLFATAQEKDSLSRLHIGGYGEAVMTRNFYSQSFNATTRVTDASTCPTSV